MSTRRDFLKRTSSVGLILATSSKHVSACGGENRPSDLARRSGEPTRNARIRSVVRRDGTVLRYGHGDNWHMSWGWDDRQYLSLCDGAGFVSQPKVRYTSRMLTITGHPEEAIFQDIPSYPMLGRPMEPPRVGPGYFGFGTLALDGYVYQFLSSFNRSIRDDELEKPELDNLARFNTVKLIFSPNNGKSWCNQDGSTPVVWEELNDRSRATMVFHQEDQEAFSLLSVLQMGKNYEHNRDGYVYVYAPNGNTEGSMNELVMFRVPKTRILERGAFEYFAGTESGGGARWSRDIEARRPVHSFPSGWVNKLVHPYAWHPSVVYNAPLGLYLMANWAPGTGTDIDGWFGVKADELWFAKPSYLGFWASTNPWGPWAQIHEELAWTPAGDPGARAYQPQIAPKWIAPDGKSFWLVWTDFQVPDKRGMRRATERDQRMSNAGGSVEADVQRTINRQRAYMPYYGFNAQRVDLAVA